jgi:hypothetical protein
MRYIVWGTYCEVIACFPCETCNKEEAVKKFYEYFKKEKIDVSVCSLDVSAYSEEEASRSISSMKNFNKVYYRGPSYSGFYRYPR